MIEREMLSTRPVAVEYRLTELGATLQTLIDALLEWSGQHLPVVRRAREEFDSARDREDQLTASPRFSRRVEPA